MLVEDDTNLREIYGERLIAEGYQIVSAGDGEEALALAVREKPDLIIADVMMPKISGFDMLDILRQAPETKDTKVIIMTALSQADDKNRASTLGADKYLVKSQVTLEDVARVVHDLLYGTETSQPDPAPINKPTPPATTASSNSLFNSPSLAFNNENNNPPGYRGNQMDESSSTTTNQSDTPVATPVAGSEPPVMGSSPVSNQIPVQGVPTPTPDTADAESTTQETAEVDGQIRQFMASKPVDQPQHVAPLVEPAPQGLTPAPSPATPGGSTHPAAPLFSTPSNTGGDKVIQPIGNNPVTQPKDINQLYAEEMAKETPNAPVDNNPAPTPNPTPEPPIANNDVAPPPATPNQAAL
jgi:CheY-like chemotaxis protein